MTAPLLGGQGRQEKRKNRSKKIIKHKIKYRYVQCEINYEDRGKGMSLSGQNRYFSQKCWSSSLKMFESFSF